MARQEKQVFPREKVAHLWAHAAQQSARDPSGNMFFTGSLLYSYGSHYVIGARLVRSDGNALFVMNDSSSSNTTNKMRYIARRALPFGDKIWIDGLKDSDFSSYSRVDLIAHAFKQAGVYFDDAANRKRNGQPAQSALHNARERIAAARMLAGYFLDVGKTHEKRIARAAIKTCDALLATCETGRPETAADVMPFPTARDNARHNAAILIRDEKRAELAASVVAVNEKMRALIALESRPDYDASDAREALQYATDADNYCKQARAIAKNYKMRCPKLPDPTRAIARLRPINEAYQRDRMIANVRAGMRELESYNHDRPRDNWHWRTAEKLENLPKNIARFELESLPGMAAIVARCASLDRKATRAVAIHSVSGKLETIKRGIESGDSYYNAGHFRDAMRDAADVAAAARDCASALAGTGARFAPRVAFDALQPEIERTAARALELSARFAEQDARELAAWRDGNGTVPRYLDHTALRLRGDTIETSRHADVPVSVAPFIWRAAMKCRVENSAHDFAGSRPQVGHFRLDAIRANGDIVVGCHDIPFSELAYIARLLGYADVPAVYG